MGSFIHSLLSFGYAVLGIIAFMIVAAALIILQLVFGQKKPVRFLRSYIQARGYHFENPEIAAIPEMTTMQMWKTVDFKKMKHATDGIETIREFANSSAASLAFLLSFQGNQVSVFGHSYSFSIPDPGDANHMNRTTVINLRVAKLRYDTPLPEFQIERRSIVTKVETVVGRIMKAAGALEKLQPVELPQYPQFSNLYRLTAKNKTETLTFLTEPKITALEQTPLTGTTATSTGFIVYFEQGKFSDEASYDEFIDRAKSALGLLLK